MQANSMTAMTRREFTILGAAGMAVLTRAAFAANGAEVVGRNEDSGEISPLEDLMREHGIIDRLMLVYDAFLRQAQAGGKPDVAIMADAAGFTERFVHGYHETLEDTFVFPALRKAGKLTDLVGILHQQHEIGRVLTADLIALAKPGVLERNDALGDLGAKARLFAAMYAAHAAREDTVVFPAFRDALPRVEYRMLGERFEELEHEKFGNEGFTGIVRVIDQLERRLDIHELRLPPVGDDVMRRARDERRHDAGHGEGLK